MHSVAIDELLCCEAIEAVHEFLLVKQEGLQPIIQGAAIGYTVLVQAVQLPYHCKKMNNKNKKSLCII